MIKTYPPAEHKYYGKYPGCWRGLSPIEAFGFYQEDEVRLGGLCLFRVELSNVGMVFQAVGIGGVWTREDCRGKGVAHALIARALKWAREQGFSAAVLYSDPKAGRLYSRFGFKSIRGLSDAQPLFACSLGQVVFLPCTEWKTSPEGRF